MRALLAVVALLAIVGAAYAATPTISSVVGTFATGDTITITGTDFGTKSPAGPVVWDDFEAGTVGADISSPAEGDGRAGTFLAPEAMNDLRYVATGAYSGSQCAYDNNDAVYQNGIFARWSTSKTGNARQVFQHMTVKLHSGNNTLVGSDSKTMRINTSGRYPGDYAQYGYPAIWGAVGRGENYYKGVTAVAGIPGSTFAKTTTAMFGDPDNEWVSFGIWGKIVAKGASTGAAGIDFCGWKSDATKLVTYSNADTIDGYRGVAFLNYIERDPTDIDTFEYWIDNVYADTTLARVTAQNLDYEGQYGSSTNGLLVMQVPFYWSATGDTIKVIVNTGAYVNETELGLVVWNSAGEASEPFTVAVSSEYQQGEATGPGKPTVTRGSGQSVVFEWNASSPAATRYQLEVMVGNEVKRYFVGNVLTATIDIPDASSIRARVFKLDADGNADSPSEWSTFSAGS